jgi:hypothetical protein
VRLYEKRDKTCKVVRAGEKSNYMYKDLKNLEQYANLSNRGAMETGDHFKNGATPKSLTSRGNSIRIKEEWKN